MNLQTHNIHFHLHTHMLCHTHTQKEPENRPVLLREKKKEGEMRTSFAVCVHSTLKSVHGCDLFKVLNVYADEFGTTTTNSDHH